jgi:mannose-6-phosphate isomerase-like protein (cupin superfamily)
MILTGERYRILSANANTDYWGQGNYPTWTRLSFLKPIPDQKKGAGVEPHYHDNDEVWLFTSGRGEVWLDGVSYPVTPNTFVYTPMGVVHRFQMFTDFANVPIVTPLEGRKRAGHLLLEEDGRPEPTASGLVVPGAENTGPFTNRGPRCPFSEMRVIDLAAGSGLAETRLSQNEHWAMVSGGLSVRVDGIEVELSPNDVALLRAGAVRSLQARSDAQVVVVRE